MQAKRRGIVFQIVLGLIVLALLLPGCGPKVPKDTLVVGIADDIDVLDPAVTSTNSSWAVSYWCYERLVDYKGATTEVGPALAKSWTVSPDGLVWEFTLRENSKFDDAKPVNAEAVKYTFDRLMAIGKGPAEAYPTLETVEVVEPYKIKFTLNAPFPPFLYALANNGASIVNPAVQSKEKDGDLGQGWLSEHTAGSGPYKLEQWVKDSQHKLVLNPNYAGTAPSIKTVLIKIVKDPSARRLQLEKGDIDVAAELPLDMYRQLEKNSNIVVKSWPSLSVTYTYMNCQKAPLDNVKFRQALSYAADYAGIISGVFLGNATQMRGPVPQGMWGYASDVKQYTYNLEKARQLLAESGVATPLTLKYLYADRDPNWEPVGLALQAKFKELGITVELEKLAYATMRENLDKGEFQLAAGNWTPDFADPYMFMNYWFEPQNWGLAGNRSWYENEQVTDLVREAARISDQAQRTTLYRQAQDLIMEDAPYIFLVQKNYNLAWRKNVEGFVFNPMLLDMYNFHQMAKK
ncbi:MAG: ABC transporter substrate-binding protein [Bacillota bacterium]|nr:ABC transporter substrate-binding protein [Bacillota bacterium]